MPSFDDLGLRPELVSALADEDLDQPTALQEAVIPALRRGGNLVARAGTGSGKTLAYGLGVLDRLGPAPEDSEETTLRFLVLVPTAEAAERVALSLYPYAQALGLGISVPGGAWGTLPSAAEILVTPSADALEAVRTSAVKLDGVEAVVIDAASAIAELGSWEQVDALLDLLPRDAQRVLFSTAFSREVEDLVDRRVKRALRYPPEPAVPEAEQAPLEGQIGYVLVTAGEKLDVLLRQLSTPEPGALPPVIFCRSDERAADLAERLSMRGFAVGMADDGEADVAVAAADTTRAELLEEADGELGQTISFDVPQDAATLTARHGGDADAVVMVTPRELPHLRETARMARLRVRALPVPPERGVAATQLNAFRDQIRRAAREEDLGAQMLVLEPLFEELSAPEIAAALTALLRRRPATATPAAQAAETTASSPAMARSAEPGPAPAPWARLYVGIGSRDDIRPGDLVGAIAGEADIKGSQVGKIEIRDTFSIVEVESAIADRVIRAVNGTTIKGRSVRVDYDRAGARPRRDDTPPRRGGGGGGGVRRQGNRPPTKRRVVRPPERE